MGHVFFYPAVSELRRHGDGEALRLVPQTAAERAPLDTRLVRAQPRPGAGLSAGVRAR
jgi:hypothetical protein